MKYFGVHLCFNMLCHAKSNSLETESKSVHFLMYCIIGTTLCTMYYRNLMMSLYFTCLCSFLYCFHDTTLQRHAAISSVCDMCIIFTHENQLRPGTTECSNQHCSFALQTKRMCVSLCTLCNKVTMTFIDLL